MCYNRKLHVLEIIMICCLSAAFSVAVAQNSDTSTNSRGRTSAEVLRSYGIELSEPSLLNALNNSNPKIRMHAAMQLAADHDSDTMPAIERALSNEKDFMTRVGIAAALGSLQDHYGIETLQSTCADATVPIRAVIYATQMLQLLSVSRAGCADNIINSLSRAEDHDYLDVTIMLLPPIYGEVSRDQANRILSSIQKLLSDGTQQPSVHIAAGQALAEIGSASSVEVVRSALSRESDPVVRSTLHADLTALEKKQ